MTFHKGDTVRLLAYHRGRDKNGVPREYPTGDTFEVISAADGWVKVKDRTAAGCVLLVPAGKLVKARETAVGVGHDGNHVGGGPVG